MNTDEPGPLSTVLTWGTDAAAGTCVLGPTGEQETSSVGPVERPFAWASVTKLVTAMAVWIAVEEGITAWDEPAGPPGSTLRHLLAHASGLSPDSPEILAPPGRARIYSNRGIEVAADHLASAAGMPFEEYAQEAVLDPLGMGATTVSGSPATAAEGPLADLLLLARELQRPRLVAAETWTVATSNAFPGLPGVLPGFGSQPDNAWGLGVEIRDHKRPHWTGRLNSPRTFGHFGRSGSFIWVDPVAGVATAALAARAFGPWAQQAWPALSDAVLADAVLGGPRED